jgi:TRAP-type C4-dicarboxylate transport system substrate-binding protein
MKPWWLAALCAASVICAPVCFSQSRWNLAGGYRAESFHSQNLYWFSQEVAKVTQGQLIIAVHPNNSLVKLSEIAKAVGVGKVEAGETIMSSLVGDIPIAGADSVPFVVGSYKDALRLWRLQRPGLERHLRGRGLRLLYAVPWPPQGLHTVRPVRSAADFRGTRMRTYNATTVRIAELLGAVPVDVPMVDVGKALAEGRMDSMITSALTGVENEVWSSIRYYYEINAWFPKNLVFVNAAAFDRLSPTVQKAVLAQAEAAEARGWTASQVMAASATDDLRRHGVRIERIPLELEADIKRLGERFSREWVRSVGNEANEIFVPYYTQP